MKATPREQLNDLVCRKVSKKVCTAFKKVDRKLFVPKKFQEYAYFDKALPLGKNSTISQPSLVAEMIDVLQLKGDEEVLEVGTGSGYNAAILSNLAKQVYSVEINENLAKEAKLRLKKLDYSNIEVFAGDGAKGLPEKAPYDGIMLTAALTDIPKALRHQLKNGGIIVYPREIGDDNQYLIKGVKRGEKIIEEAIIPVRFVKII